MLLAETRHCPMSRAGEGPATAASMHSLSAAAVAAAAAADLVC